MEAFFTANFLSNLLSTSVHDKMGSPFKILYGQPHVYSALRVFGRSCYLYLRSYAQNKFDPKSLLYVLLLTKRSIRVIGVFTLQLDVFISIDMFYLMNKGFFTLIYTRTTYSLQQLLCFQLGIQANQSLLYHKK